MKEKAPTGDLHAYVDNCLSESRRVAVEAELQGDEELRRQVEIWKAQNQAIRLAFGGAVAAPPVMPRRSSPSERQKPAESYSPKARETKRRFDLWRTVAAPSLAALALFWTAGAAPPSADPAMRAVGVAAFRAFGDAAPSRFDVHADNATALAAKFDSRYWNVKFFGALAPRGWTVRGAKRIPGVLGEAMFIAFANPDSGEVGLVVEALDAPPNSQPDYAWKSGFTVASFARNGFGVAAIARDEGAVADFLADSGLDGFQVGR